MRSLVTLITVMCTKLSRGICKLVCWYDFFSWTCTTVSILLDRLQKFLLVLIQLTETELIVVKDKLISAHRFVYSSSRKWLEKFIRKANLYEITEILDVDCFYYHATVSKFLFIYLWVNEEVSSPATRFVCFGRGVSWKRSSLFHFSKMTADIHQLVRQTMKASATFN